MKSISLKAYAKINLTLDVLGKRADGYHDVKMIMQGINLYDIVTLESCENGITLSCDVTGLGEDRKNLAYRAAELMLLHYPQIKGLRITLEKRIPVAAGLGGGSADAAAVILGVNELYDLGLTKERLQEIALHLGSDVPFCLFPCTALAEGRGERLTDIVPCPLLWLVLVKPSFGVATKEVYENLKNVTIKKRPDTRAALRAIEETDIELLYCSMGNVLEYSTFALYPDLQRLVDELILLGAKKVMMSGSGTTLLMFMNNEDDARAAALCCSKAGRDVIVTRTNLPEDVEMQKRRFVHGREEED